MAPVPMENDMEMSFGKHRGRLISESWLQSLGLRKPGLCRGTWISSYSVVSSYKVLRYHSLSRR